MYNPSNTSPGWVILEKLPISLKLYETISELTESTSEATDSVLGVSDMIQIVLEQDLGLEHVDWDDAVDADDDDDEEDE